MPRSDQLPHVGLQRCPGIAVGDSRDTKIKNLWLAGFIDQDISRLEIVVNETTLMRVMHCIADLHHHLQAVPYIPMFRFRIIPRDRPRMNSIAK